MGIFLEGKYAPSFLGVGLLGKVYGWDHAVSGNLFERLEEVLIRFVEIEIITLRLAILAMTIVESGKEDSKLHY